MAKSIFVSYNFNDREVSKSVKNMMQQHRDEIDGQIVFVENDVSYNGDTAIDWEIEHTMEKCDAALFVLGDNVRNSPWVNREADHAIAKHIPIVTTQLPDMECSKPSALADCTMLGWDTSEMCTHLNQC